MKKIMKILSYVMDAIGITLIYCGVSTADYYLIELVEAEPAYTWLMIIGGMLCMIPILIYMYLKESR